MIMRKDSTLAVSVVSDILRWIEDDLSKPMSVIQIAIRSGYSHWHFQRIFKLVTGYPVAGYIRKRRLETAAELLKASDKAITDILLSVGFDDHATFCRVFRRHFKISPTKYRSLQSRHSSTDTVWQEYLQQNE